MRVQVTVKTQSKNKQESDVGHSFDLVVSKSDTVLSLKERVLSIEPTPFPDQELIFAGKALADAEQLAGCGVQEGSFLELVVTASAEVFSQQLLGLLKDETLSLSELGLLYCHRHGITVGQVMKALGREGEQLCDFLKGHGLFEVEGGRARGLGKALGRIPEEDVQTAFAKGRVAFNVEISITLETPSGTNEACSLDLAVDGASTVLSLRDRIKAAELLPFTENQLVFDGKVLDDQQVMMDCGVKDGSFLEFVVQATEEAFAGQLAELLQGRPRSLNELSLLYSCRHGVTVSRVLKIFGWGEKFPSFLKRQPRFVVKGGCAILASGWAAAKPAHELQALNRRCLDLHARICGADFCEAAAEALERVTIAIKDATFLDLGRIVRGGSVARGTAIEGAADAELVLLLNDPAPGLLRSAAAKLLAHLTGTHGFEQLGTFDDGFRVGLDGLWPVNVFLAPAPESYGRTLKLLAAAEPEAQQLRSPLLSEQRAAFAARQTEAVKVTMRLLRWWREQRSWSSEAARPADELLELIAAYAAASSQPADQRAAVEASLTLLARFDTLCVTWPAGQRSYSEDAPPEALLRERPLLADPVDPFVNVANPQGFDPRELMAHAQSALSGGLL